MFISKDHLAHLDIEVENLETVVNQTRSYAMASINEINKKINALVEFLGVQFAEDPLFHITVVKKPKHVPAIKKPEPSKKAAVKAPSTKTVPSKHPVSKPTKKAK